MERKKEFIVNIIFITIIFGLIYLFSHYILKIVSPFIIGFLFAYIAIKFVRRFIKKDNRLYRCLSLIGLYLCIILLLILLISFGINKISGFVYSLPNFFNKTINPSINQLKITIDNLNKTLPEDISAVLNTVTESVFDSIKTILSTLASSLVTLTTTVISTTPEVLISIIITIVSSFYIVMDYERIAKWLTDDFLSSKALSWFYEIKDFCENILLKIIKAYLFIMLVTFIELAIGLTIIRINNSGIIAFFIAILDILPVLGVGTVLIPWGVICLLTDKLALGIEILVIYFIITFVRNIIEPRIVGTNLDLHPLATLMAMIVGLQLFGAVGMFGLPLALSFFKNRKKHI